MARKDLDMIALVVRMAVVRSLTAVAWKELRPLLSRTNQAHFAIFLTTAAVMLVAFASEQLLSLVLRVSVSIHLMDPVEERCRGI